ncbi:MAG: GNAT family N-acetyltransferase [Acidobacteriota bacterium]|nr:GNAT family N-acetyltransferase [Acidobacteriota bacterium]
MSGYRFCRTDDIPLLVEAHNACYVDHFDDVPALTVEGYKTLVREIDLWASSCMLATVDDEVVGVLFATKRDDRALIHSIGVQRAHRRQGHGRHLLDSLSQKLAILGPPEMVAEIPGEWTGVRAFFERCGYTPGPTYTDFVLEKPSAAPRGGPVVPVGVDDLHESGVLEGTAGRAWERTLKTLLNRRETLEGYAVASDVRIEAYLLARQGAAGHGREIVALGAAEGEEPRALLRILVHHFCGRESSPVTIPKVSPAEIDFGELERGGFRKTRDWVAYTRRATPA